MGAGTFVGPAVELAWALVRGNVTDLLVSRTPVGSTSFTDKYLAGRRPCADPVTQRVERTSCSISQRPKPKSENS